MNQPQRFVNAKLHLLTCCTGLIVFDAVLGAKAASQTPQPLCISAMTCEDEEFQKSVIAQTKLSPSNYQEVLELTEKWGGYTSLAHNSLVGRDGHVPNASSDHPRTPAQAVAATFDALHACGFFSQEHVWLARTVSDGEKAQPWEWHIHPGLVGVAMPDAMVDYFLQEAAERADQESDALTNQPTQGA